MLNKRISVVFYFYMLLGIFPLLYAQETDEVEKSIESSKDEKPTKNIRNDVHDMVIDELIHRLEKLKTSNSDPDLQNVLEEEKHFRELQRLQQEKDLVQLENELFQEKIRRELAKLSAEKEKVQLENELLSAKQTQLLANINDVRAKLEAETAVSELKQRQQLLTFEEERTRLMAQNALQEEKNKQQELLIQSENVKMQFEMAKLEFEKAKRATESEELSEKINRRGQKQEWESQVNAPQEYLEEPFVNGQLTISDRRIYLEGPIYAGTAKAITDRIHYFNNKSTKYPIFIVISSCPGGSVMEGAEILKAMQASRAPVYVVVKELAASMAAVIVANAKRSFAYPNALIIHHQVWGLALGNVTQQAEQLQFTKEWSKRMIQPIADKMGISMEDFIKQMYQNNSEGNWREFADNAVKIKWVDYIVDNIIDTSFTKQPQDGEESDPNKNLSLQIEKEKEDEKGQRYMKLPSLKNPLDVYYLYNPNNYYRY